MNKITPNAVKYSIQHLMQVAGVKSDFIIKIDDLSVHIFVDGKKIVFNLLSPNKTIELLEGKLNFESILSFDSKFNIPIFLVNKEKKFTYIENDILFINADIVTISFIMLSRFEELLVNERDQYDRFQYKNSLAFKYDFIDTPIVDEYALLLRKELVRFIPNFNYFKRYGKIIPTHDIDFMSRYGNMFKIFKTIIGGDLFIRKNIMYAIESIRQLPKFFKNTMHDPMIIGINKLLDLSNKYDLNSVFYFKGMKFNEKDCTYDIFIPEVQNCIKMILSHDMKIGVHGGVDSFTDSKVLEVEKKRIETVSKSKIINGRQHFLKFDINITLDIWVKNGIMFDSTLGYAEREGFRCGTCHQYYLYNLKKDRPSDVIELPLIVMEGTLYSYRNMNHKIALEKVIKLYKRCKDVEGDFVILWHNSSVFGRYKIYFENVYVKFIELVGNKSI